jgi:hypothetical protein
MGPILHLAAIACHEDIRSRRFEIGSGLAGVVSSPCGDACSIRRRLAPWRVRPRPRARHPVAAPWRKELFHYRGWHRSGRFPAALQLLLAGATLGALIVRRRGAG